MADRSPEREGTIIQSGDSFHLTDKGKLWAYRIIDRIVESYGAEMRVEEAMVRHGTDAAKTALQELATRADNENKLDDQEKIVLALALDMTFETPVEAV